MKVAVVHLSDIHFKNKLDTGFKRQEKLANVIAFSRSAGEQLLFAVTGDVAYSGNQSEYETAEAFFNTILIGLGLSGPTKPFPIVFIPGNHDANFREVGDLRPKLLESIHEQLGTLDVNGETVSTLLRVQANFFKFVSLMTGETIPLGEQLFFTRIIPLGEYKLEFRCFNSAWLSRTNDKVGELGLPSSIVDAARAKTDSDVVISMIHHPHNWLDTATYQSFRTAIQESSDFLFTGHEHTQGGQVISSFSGSTLVHFEGGPFQPPYGGDSEFGILHIDFERRTWRREEFKWLNGSYYKASDGELSNLADTRGTSSSLPICAPFLKKLGDPGTGFLHPREPHLSLADIYIFPDLRTRAISKLRVSAELPKALSSADVPSKILAAERVVISGPTDCGKTALSKTLFVEANKNYGRYSLLVCGKNFAGTDPETACKKAIDAAIDETYGPKSRGRYAELNREERVLLIDDWDEVSFNREGRSLILQNVTAHFGTVILFADDTFLIEELAARHEHRPLATFQVADIKEFGFRLRGQIIRKWHSLGNNFIEDEQVIARNIAASTRVIDTALGRNLLPSYPVNIITLLQTYDAGDGSNSGLGSYGQVYEALITARLARVSIKSIDIGTKITFLSRIAWYLFTRGQRCVSSAEWHDLGESYFEQYKIRIESRHLLKSFLDAGILVNDGHDYRFSYGYAYCYFVAKYFQEGLADSDEHSGRPELFEKLKKLSESVYKQDNANIVIFYLFLTKDRSLIYHVIANARLIFSEHTEFDFDEHLRFVNTIVKPLPAINLPDTPPDQNQQNYDKSRDDAGEQIEPGGATEVIYAPELPFEQKFVIGIRYLTLMGQILRNFPGSLKGDTKLELAFESYSLGLRILAAIFSFAEKDSQEIIKDISNVLRTKMAFSGNDKELRDRAELIVAELLREIAFALLKRVSHAIGLKELEATYDEVSALRDSSLPSRLIQLSIRLDHFDEFPKKDIEGLAKELEKNVFTYQTLRDLVLNHLYLFPTEYAIQQWSGQTLKFKVNTPQIRGSAAKMLEG
jgi:predicted MPP superfamily phosphohydrolase